jgi:hypothetical protein
VVESQVLTMLIAMMFLAFPSCADYSLSHTVSSLLDIGPGTVRGIELVVKLPLWKTSCRNRRWCVGNQIVSMKYGPVLWIVNGQS